MIGRVSVFELTEEGLEAAVDAVQAGHQVVVPTDTVYGIAADPFSEKAVTGLLEAKHRGRDMPPPVLIADRLMMRALVAEVPPAAKELATAFWPGPLTLILRAQKSLGLHLGETKGTVALRVPDHDGTRELLRRTGPLAVSSANISGQPPATNADEAQAQLGDAVAVYLDGGPTPGLVPSTIVDFSQTPTGLVLRLGVLTLEQLRQVAKDVELYEEPNAQTEPEAEKVPGSEATDDGAEPVVADEAHAHTETGERTPAQTDEGAPAADDDA